MLHIMHSIKPSINISEVGDDITLPECSHEWDTSLANFLSVFLDRREAQRSGTRREKFKMFVKTSQVKPYVVSRELAEGLWRKRTYKSAEKKFEADMWVGFVAKGRDGLPTLDNSKPYGYCVCINGMMVDAFQKFPHSQRNTFKSTKEVRGARSCHHLLFPLS